MNSYGIVLKPARVALLLFALSLILALLIVTGLSRYRVEKQQDILKTEQQLNDTRQRIEKLTFDLNTITELADKYKKLSKLGFVGEPDRDGWVQRLESLYQETRLPPTLRYTLAPPQPVDPKATDTDIGYQVLHHDLSMELSGIHEGELLDFMEKLGGNWRAPYRVDSCQIARGEAEEPVTGLQIKCLIKLYSLPLKP